MSPLRKILKTPLLALLAWPAFRRRAIFELCHGHYAELENRIPLGDGLVCPLAFPEAWNSFAEMFVQREYAPCFEQIPLPGRWLDLGCHAGFFSLFVVWLRAQRNLTGEISALLVDGDARMAKPVSRLIEQNHLQSAFQFRHGAIAKGQGEVEFVERGFMSSSVGGSSQTGGRKQRVPILDAEKILRLLPPPYDLVKVDIEGSEHDLLTHYRPLLEQARYLILEWHSWHGGGGGEAELKSLLNANRFATPREIVPVHTVSVSGVRGQCGVWLTERQGFAP